VLVMDLNLLGLQRLFCHSGSTLRGRAGTLTSLTRGGTGTTDGGTPRGVNCGAVAPVVQTASQSVYTKLIVRLRDIYDSDSDLT
jgi:hypothetical protein